jgi:molybdopterin molybdotransferase
MDGIAFVHDEFLNGRRRFRIAGTVAAGAKPLALPAPDCCLEVMTGAMLPPGTDTVVPVEDIETVAGHAQVSDNAKVSLRGNIHCKGIDAREGDVLLAGGAVLRGPELAIAASAGATRLAVSREPRICVISTGDELVPADAQPLPWQIRRSNAYGIAGTLLRHGYDQLTDMHVADDPTRVREAVAEALASSDVLILSGGVSAGRFDHVPDALRDLGVERVFHKVAQRPGKPLWFGVHPSGKAVFALPGNPVSTLICLVRYALPALRIMRGATPGNPILAALGEPFENRHDITLFVPVDQIITGQSCGMLKPHPTHGSGDFAALAGTAGFVELAPKQKYETNGLAPFYTW